MNISIWNKAPYPGSVKDIRVSDLGQEVSELRTERDLIDVKGKRRPWKGRKVNFGCNQSESGEKGPLTRLESCNQSGGEGEGLKGSGLFSGNWVKTLSVVKGGFVRVINHSEKTLYLFVCLLGCLLVFLLIQNNSFIYI